MKTKKVLSVLLAAAMMSAMFTGCGGGETDTTSTGTNTNTGTDTSGSGESSNNAAGSGEIKEFTAFFAVPGTEINDDNEIQQMIAEKTGVKVKETWLTGQKAQ